ncbi:MAG: DUF805 domain-containing protein [Muribaculaceae bacterium]|nr:DUF805 domain-containing protein [Muribaculaceae bacterium]
MTFGQSVSTCFRNYCCFTGRASRSEYWWWVLFTAIIGILFSIPYGINMAKAIAEGTEPGLPVISYIVNLVLLLPTLGVMFRRLHDTGRSGWWWLIGLIPVVGTIVLLVFLLQPSQPYDNQYGPVPEN